MRTTATMTGAAVAAALVLATGAIAQDVGEMEYRNSCAQCHGTDGTGGGPLSAFLVSQPPDLTVLAAAYGGVFPVEDVYAVIDGSADVAQHGGREMPLWGDRYAQDMRVEITAHYTAEEARAYAVFRILALVEYLNSIQRR